VFIASEPRWRALAARSNRISDRISGLYSSMPGRRMPSCPLQREVIEFDAAGDVTLKGCRKVAGRLHGGLTRRLPAVVQHPAHHRVERDNDRRRCEQAYPPAPYSRGLHRSSIPCTAPCPGIRAVRAYHDGRLKNATHSRGVAGSRPSNSEPAHFSLARAFSRTG
jgi:hypothetical protein